VLLLLLLRHVVLKEKRVIDRISVLLTLLVRCFKGKKEFMAGIVACFIATCCFKGEKSCMYHTSAL
jgi:hypothetical protein